MQIIQLYLMQSLYIRAAISSLQGAQAQDTHTRTHTHTHTFYLYFYKTCNWFESCSDSKRDKANQYF